MGAPEPLPKASSDITEWLPLLGSIVQALCGGREGEPTDAPRGGGSQTASRSDEKIR